MTDENLLAIDSDDPAYRVAMAELNDRFRKNPFVYKHGRFMVTADVRNLGEEDMVAAIDAMRNFENFNTNNDPWGEHDCALFQITRTNGNKATLKFKIDYYDTNLEFHSPNPLDENKTIRVLTITMGNE